MSQNIDEALKSLKEEITCNICLLFLNDPRALPCTHVYCKECLQRELSRCHSLSTNLKCPVCRKDVHLRDNNVENLCKDFRTLRLREVYENLCPPNQEQTENNNITTEKGMVAPASGEQSLSPANVPLSAKTVTCELHHKPLDMYCITCKDVLCLECEKTHTTHTYHNLIKENVLREKVNEKSGPGSNVFPGEQDEHDDNTAHKKRWQASELSATGTDVSGSENTMVPRTIEPVIQEKLDKTSSLASEIESIVAVALVETTQLHSDIEGQAHNCQLQVDAVFEGMIELLQQKRHYLHREIKEELRNKKEVLAQQREQLTTIYKEVVKIVDTSHSEAIRDRESASQRLFKLQLMSERVKQLTLKPAVTADMGKCLTKSNHTKACCKDCMFKLHIPDISKCRVEGDLLKNTEPNKFSHLSLRVYDAKGVLCPARYLHIEAEILCVRSKSKTLANVTNMQKGIYILAFMSKERGNHVVNVRVNHIPIPQCPISIFLEKKPQTYIAPINQIENQNGPRALQICMNNLVVSEEYSFTVSMYSESGGRVLTIEIGGEFAADLNSKSYFVANAISYQLFKFDTNGFRVKRVGSQGVMPGQFQNPGGMAFHNGELFVTDSDNHRIQVFDRDLEFLRCFGREGNDSDCFKYPRDLTIDGNGDLYVTDMLNNRIQVLSKNGHFIRRIRKEGQQRIYPRTPFKIKLHRDHLFVTEHLNNSVCVFTKSGNFVTSFGEQYLVNPEGIAINEDGHVYVSSNKEKIFVF